MTRSSSAEGTSPLEPLDHGGRHPDEALGLGAEEPGGVDDLLDVLGVGRRPGTAASGYSAKRTGVTMLTRWSVDWADRIVAARSWNGVS